MNHFAFIVHPGFFTEGVLKHTFTRSSSKVFSELSFLIEDISQILI